MKKDDLGATSALNAIIKTLNQLNATNRKRVLNAVSTFFHQIGEASEVGPDIIPGDHRIGRPSFSSSHTPTPKEFILDKAPRTDVERIACLAYYLTHYRNLVHFKTLDLAKLNTEAAQPKFSNSAYSATNAAKMGYLVPASKGQRQISAAGEQFVQALPDRDAAKSAMTRARPRKLARKKKGK